MAPIPDLGPGDYILWHPDLAYAIDNHPPARIWEAIFLPSSPISPAPPRSGNPFLLGHPSPDFGGGRGERAHLGRPGVQDVNDAGGEDGLMAMGLLPWNEKLVSDPVEKEVCRMANGILFPDRYGL
ncbi:unnamed protein product [Parascedosporium putredinis]|uniref:Uncharacterized protein n=1 Tax=Parascedosporium putredinis TaxID=1442378 RepID=A0A9P1HAE6_9PEZI|nr:unnamed protein product [Parascedosporium putredinis]CAI8002032.1 unnamed protein product [Parascedosporium putredinis]